MTRITPKWAAACMAFAVSSAASLPASYAQDANAPGLTGEFRANAVSTAVAACRKLKDDSRTNWIPRDLVDQSCTCVANRMADQISVNDTTRLLIALMGAGVPTKADTLIMLDSVGTCLSEIAQTTR